MLRRQRGQPILSMVKELVDILAGEGFVFTLSDGVENILNEFVGDLFVFHASFHLKVAHYHGRGLAKS